jgi:hypothetical protein
MKAEQNVAKTETPKTRKLSLRAVKLEKIEVTGHRNHG